MDGGVLVSDFIDSISKNRLFILGSGFSAGAGIPMIGTLLSEAMAIFKRESIGLFERVNNHAKICFQKDYIDFNAVDFAHFCTFLEYIELREYGGGERFSDKGSREKIAFKYYLSKAIAMNTPAEDEIPEMYCEFAKQLHKYDIVITFNWDTLLEMALKRVGKTYAYYNFENKEADIYIYKLHGSVNWRLGDTLFSRRPNLTWEPLNFKIGMMDNEIYYCNDLLKKNTWSQYAPFSEVEPFIVLPGYGKGFDVRHIAPLWYKPENAFAYTKNVYIIGFRLADDDYFVRSFFIHNLPYVGDYYENFNKILYIINPDEKVKENFDFIDDGDYVKYIFEKFSMKHIELMKEG